MHTIYVETIIVNYYSLQNVSTYYFFHGLKCLKLCSIAFCFRQRRFYSVVEVLPDGKIGNYLGKHTPVLVAKKYPKKSATSSMNEVSQIKTRQEYLFLEVLVVFLFLSKVQHLQNTACLLNITDHKAPHTACYINNAKSVNIGIVTSNLDAVG